MVQLLFSSLEDEAAAGMSYKQSLKLFGPVLQVFIIEHTNSESGSLSAHGALLLSVGRRTPEEERSGRFTALLFSSVADCSGATGRRQILTE